MDPMTMQKLARFKIMTRRLGGFNVDIFRMAQEPEHAREVLRRAQEVDSENLILLALELSEALGLLEEALPPARAAKTPEPRQLDPEPEISEGRYVFGARG